MKVPTKEDWGNYKADHDVRYAYKLYGGLTIDEAIEDFITSPIERSSELLFAPFKIFKYYVHCFIKHLISENGAEEADMANCFMGLTRNMSQKHPAEFAEFYPKIKEYVAKVAQNQEFYDADYDIYGNFTEVLQKIEQNVAKINENFA